MTLVLLVDEKTDNLDAVRTSLEEAGFRIQAARNGAEALEAAQNFASSQRALGRELDERSKAMETQSAILNAIPARIVIVDDNGVILSSNAEWRAFARANHSREQHDEIGAEYLEVFTNGEVARASDAHDATHNLQAVLGGHLDVFEMEYQAGSANADRWFRMIITPLRDGQRHGAVITHIDVTDKRKAEASFRESEERFRQVVDNIQEVFWLRDAVQGNMLYISPAYSAIWGRSLDELYAQPSSWIDAIHKEDRDSVRNAFLMQSDGGYDETYRIERPDGVIRWVRDRAFPVRDSNNAVYRIVGIAEDITERKRIEAQFLRSQRLESLGTLAGGIAHDLNNVLTPIIMAIDLLKSEGPPEERNAILGSILTSAERGAEMVQQVLSFARGVEGRRVAVDLQHVIREVEKIANDTIFRNLQLRVEIAHAPLMIDGDATQLHQLLLNLVVNSRDAMPNGGLLTILADEVIIDEQFAAFEPLSHTGAYVVVTVTDTGVGMPAAVVERMFDPFFTTKDTGKGTGLGLSTSQAIVHSHGGFIHVNSVVGEGTSVSVYIPARSDHAFAPQLPPDIPVLRGDGELILFVDDDAVVREIGRRTLEASGYRVLLAVDGAEAVATFAAHRHLISAVLTDMAMPVMDGTATIMVIRRISPATPIIALSGNEGSRVPGDGATVELKKPYTSAALLQTLHDVLQKSNAQVA